MSTISNRYPQVTRTAEQIREAMRTARTESELAALVEESLRASRTAPAPSATPPASRTLPPAAAAPTQPPHWRQLTPEQNEAREEEIRSRLAGRGAGSSAITPWGSGYVPSQARGSNDGIPRLSDADLATRRGAGAVSGGLRAL